MCRGVLLELLNERPGSPALVPVLQEVLYGDGDCDSLFDMTRGKVLLLFNDEMENFDWLWKRSDSCVSIGVGFWCSTCYACHVYECDG